jgi:hypothetical protein
MYDLVEWAAEQPLVGRQCRHDRDQLFRHDPDGGRRRAAAPPESNHAGSGYVRPVRLGHAPWSCRHFFRHAVPGDDRNDVGTHQQALAEQAS